MIDVMGWWWIFGELHGPINFLLLIGCAQVALAQPNPICSELDVWFFFYEFAQIISFDKFL
jgi:hypothetical protein